MNVSILLNSIQVPFPCSSPAKEAQATWNANRLCCACCAAVRFISASFTSPQASTSHHSTIPYLPPSLSFCPHTARQWNLLAAGPSNVADSEHAGHMAPPRPPPRGSEFSHNSTTGLASSHHHPHNLLSTVRCCHVGCSADHNSRQQQLSRRDERFASLAYVLTDLQYKAFADMRSFTQYSHRLISVLKALEAQSSGKYHFRLN